VLPARFEAVRGAAARRGLCGVPPGPVPFAAIGALSPPTA
jgi:hypothetical protein